MKNLFKKIGGLIILLSAQCGIAHPEAAPVVYTEDKPAIVLSADQHVFSIRLKSNPTTGYSWFLRYVDLNLIHPVKHSFESAANKKLMGAPGYEIWEFSMKPVAFNVPSQTLIRFVYERPWDINTQGKQVVFRVTTQ